MKLTPEETKFFYNMMNKLNSYNDRGEYYCLNLFETPLLAKILNSIKFEVKIE